MSVIDLDFSELRTGEDARGHGLQNLLAVMGEKLGFEVEAGGSGADKGRDLFFTRRYEIAPGLFFPSKILVSCKDKTESGNRLKTSDISGWSDRVAEHGCSGFILATTVVPTDDLVTQIRDTASRNNFEAKVWQPNDLKKILLDRQDSIFRFTIARFFPKSSRASDPDNLAFDLFIESLKHLELEKSLELGLQYLEEVQEPFSVWELLETLVHLKGCSLEEQLQKHFFQALELDSEELAEALTDPINTALLNCAFNSQLDDQDWEEIEVRKLSTQHEDVLISFVGTVSRYVMGDVMSDHVTGSIIWSATGFSLSECESAWDKDCEYDYLAEQDGLDGS